MEFDLRLDPLVVELASIQSHYTSQIITVYYTIICNLLSKYVLFLRVYCETKIRVKVNVSWL